jgi:motility quorum-sensing regulator/GCU-specific mRNA interferase toxin
MAFMYALLCLPGPTVWQDVYRPSTKTGDVYLKLTVIDDVLIVSFKEL